MLADFIAEGHFARHLRRMRTLSAERQKVLVEAAKRELGRVLEIALAEAGLHLLAYLPKGMDDRKVSQRLAASQVEAPPLSSYASSRLKRGGLVLGYAAVTEREIREGIRRMKAVLDAG